MNSKLFLGISQVEVKEWYVKPGSKRVRLWRIHKKSKPYMWPRVTTRRIYVFRFALANDIIVSSTMIKTCFISRMSIIIVIEDSIFG